MAELVTGPDGALVDGVLRLGADGIVAVEGYEVTTTRTPDGLRYDIRTPGGERLAWTAPTTTGHRTLVLGGARSGKSTEAERLLHDHPDTVYVATGYTGTADDPEWAERIARHRERRPATWGLAETVDLVPLLATDGPPLLIDCLTLWLARVMDDCEVWTDHAGVPDVESRIAQLAAAWSQTPRLVVAVSNEVGSGVVPADAGTRLYRDLMGRLNATIARRSDHVLWCLAGRTIPL
ncbi:adenosylcobinamide kinase /adenosylcobinamide-phosphate guanylyltransferase [Kribbella voronezhensis]|uniref:Adenosylcobinamide kinase n=1 Tax=Kribbella voronezhensis TaxID=2512212 RepID=A0A4R7T5R4_9ACTN|nr:bifunctional adenosylcobinamide kinase/adenosylcobinamide-phosphate guanylyltransferase [Kribbella voronezhensis]TDU87134.1 adenosylcobinamide kinase /adenosylcobinamide-phosphate guanylyltransferase [Kribbella voronezhensis]